VFIDKNGTGVVLIVRARSFTVSIETVHCSMGTKPEFPVFQTSVIALATLWAPSVQK